jgi:hypothetical protein
MTWSIYVDINTEGACCDEKAELCIKLISKRDLSICIARSGVCGAGVIAVTYRDMD